MLVASEVGVALLDLYNSVQRAAELLEFSNGFDQAAEGGADGEFFYSELPAICKDRFDVVIPDDVSEIRQVISSFLAVKVGLSQCPLTSDLFPAYSWFRVFYGFDCVLHGVSSLWLFSLLVCTYITLNACNSKLFIGIYVTILREILRHKSYLFIHISSLPSVHDQCRR